MKTNRLLIAAALAAATLFPALAHAQSVGGPTTFWNNLDALPNPANVSAYSAGSTVQGTGAAAKSSSTPGWTVNPNPPPARLPSGLVLLGLAGVATQDGDATPDTFNLILSSSQSFTINPGGAWVQIPAYLNGNLSFVNANANTTTTITAVVQILDNTNTPVGPSINMSVTRTAAQGNLAISDANPGFFSISGANLPAGNYTERATFTVTGNAGIAALNGSKVTTDMNSAAIYGLATTLGIYPLGLGDSRVAVKAPAASARWGVDGSGVIVGVLDPGQAYNTNTKVPITTYDGSAAVPGLFGEHALAVASIIGARGAGAGNNGVAPGVTIDSAAMNDPAFGAPAVQTKNAALALAAGGARVINMSANDSTYSVADVNALINANPIVTFVKSVGNGEPLAGNSVTTPGMSPNIIAVGGLNKDFTRRADFSSFSHNATPIKPDIVAPSEYITAAVSRDIDFNGTVDDFNKAFTGNDFRSQPVTAGDISGTSFAAPHVAGAAALIYQYGDDNFAFQADAQDHRVIKVNLLHGATVYNPTNGNVLLHQDGTTQWNQGIVAGTSPGPSNPLKVSRSIDTELGAGLLDTDRALLQYSSGKVTGPAIPGASSPAHTLDADVYLSQHHENFWDLQTLAQNDNFNYGLPDISGNHFRATMTWDDEGSGLATMDLQLFRYGGTDLDPFDSPELIGETVSNINPGENVKLLDFIVPNLGPQENPGYFLRILNEGGGGADTTYALAVTVPEPATWGLFLLAAVILVMSRRVPTFTRKSA